MPSLFALSTLMEKVLRMCIQIGNLVSPEGIRNHRAISAIELQDVLRRKEGTGNEHTALGGKGKIRRTAESGVYCAQVGPDQE